MKFYVKIKSKNKIKFKKTIKLILCYNNKITKTKMNKA